MGEEIRETEEGMLEAVDTDTGEIIWTQKPSRERQSQIKKGKAIKKRKGRPPGDKKNIFHEVVLSDGRIAVVPKGFNPDDWKVPEVIPYNRMHHEIIVDSLLKGDRITDICKKRGMPDYATVCRWRSKNSKFDDDFKMAKKFRAEALVDEAQDIVMKTADKNDVPASRLQSDFLKWRAEKENNEDYGSKTKIEGADPQVNIQIVTGVPQSDQPVEVKIDGKDTSDRDGVYPASSSSGASSEGEAV